MKKIFTTLLAAAFALSVAGLAVAAEKKAPPASGDKAAAAAEKAPAAKKAAKPKTTQLTGTIESLDAAAGTFSVKGKKGVLDLKAGEKVKLGDFKIGDKVVVKHAEGTALSVKAVMAKTSKAKKAESKPSAELKPASKPAEKK